MSHALQIASLSTLNRQAALPVLAVWAVSFAVLVTKWDSRRRSRLALKHLPTHVLNDLGITRYEALYEARKPFWQH